MTAGHCDHCGEKHPAPKLAPYFVGNVMRHSCEAVECREISRAEIRRGALVSSRRAAA